MQDFTTYKEFRAHFKPKTYASFREFANAARTLSGKKIDIKGRKAQMMRLWKVNKNMEKFLVQLYEIKMQFDVSKFKWKKDHFHFTNKTEQHKFLVNLFYREMWSTKVRDIPTLWESLLAFVNDTRIENHLIMKSVLFLWPNSTLYSTIMRPLGGFTSKASILDPTLAFYVMNQFEHTSILCPTLSWGSTALAARYLPGCKEFVGIDVLPEVCDKVNRVILQGMKHKIYCKPSEEVKFPKKYTKHFDLVFYSPPYYDIEVYSEDEKQSTSKFTTYESWVAGYLKPTIDLCIKSLKHGGHLVAFVGTDMLNDYKKSVHIPFNKETAILQGGHKKGFKNTAREYYVVHHQKK